MGKADREPSPAEMEKMKNLVRKAMEDGAFGLSTGLYYVPGSYAKTEEIIELAKVVREFDGIYATHIRDEGGNNMGGLLAAIREAIKIGEEANVPVQIAHIKAYTKSNWGKSKDVCAIIEEARARGVKVFADQYPYPASSTSLSAIALPRWVKAGGKMEENIKNPALKDKLILGIKERMDLGVVPDMLKIATFEEKKEWEGKTLEDISVLMKLPPIETIIKVLQIGDPDLIIFGMSLDDVEYFMKKPYIMTSSDGGNVTYGVGLPHPRNYGAFPRKIRHYVLEKGIITMEHAIRAATSLPAEMVGLKERGLIKEGFIADIVVFNPETIKDIATFTAPHQYSEGIEYLLVNGVLAIKDGEYTGTLAGKPLKMSKN
jgi:N-acyl-D-aspartate/D-glutamate deacylase